MIKLLIAILLLTPNLAWGQFGKFRMSPLTIESQVNKLISIEFNADSTQIILTIKSEYYHQMIGTQESMYRDTYSIVNGKIKFIKRQYADYTPQRIETIPEKIEWKEKDE